jgi:ERCC4-related helicase
MPIYDIKKDSMEIREIPAPKSTLIQRKGRLGRLNTVGTYILCSEKNNHTKEYHDSELEKIELSDIYFGILKSIESAN